MFIPAVLVAMHGNAVGIGITLALPADIRVVWKGAKVKKALQSKRYILVVVASIDQNMTTSVLGSREKTSWRWLLNLHSQRTEQNNPRNL